MLDEIRRCSASSAGVRQQCRVGIGHWQVCTVYRVCYVAQDRLSSASPAEHSTLVVDLKPE